MTSATTIIALLPILTSTGRGADIMIPMAIPAFGGMILQQSPILSCRCFIAGGKRGRLGRKIKKIQWKYFDNKLKYGDPNH